MSSRVAVMFSNGSWWGNMHLRRADPRHENDTTQGTTSELSEISEQVNV